MNYKETIEFIANKISAMVSSDKCQCFYIGKTENYMEREYLHKENGYDNVWKIAHGTSKTINNAEKDLIEIFKKNPKLNNENAGGGGNPEADTLYLAIRAKIESVDELYEDALPIDGLDDIEIPD